MNPSKNRPVAWWLLFCCAMIFTMVVVGGVTRLTRSGLSMTNWKPIRGILPPMTQEAWQKEFARYKQFPEYKKVNKGMTLAEFKSIFFWEYFHRLWGRLIGLAFFLPFVFFWWTGRLNRKLAPKLLLIFIGGGAQGLLGWYMVKSGLVNRPSVSQYRLVAHLTTAFALYAYTAWVAWDLLFPRPSSSPISPETRTPISTEARTLRLSSFGLAALLCLMILSGGFVAGLKAGFVYNTFPLMGDRFVPSNLLAFQPWYRNFFENMATVQFTHRMLAYLLCVILPVYAWFALKHPITSKARNAIFVLLALFVAQVTLGITTLLLHVPVPLAAMHQAGALCLFTAALFVNHQIRCFR